MLNGIKIKNYALLKDVEIGLQLTDLLQIKKSADLTDLPCLNQLTVLIGENASGKSTFFESLQFLATLLLKDVQVASNQSVQGSYYHLINSASIDENMIEFDLLFRKSENTWLRYYLKISSDQNNRPFLACESVEKYDLRSGQIDRSLILQTKEGLGTVYLEGLAQKIELTERKISALHIFGHQTFYKDLVWLYRQITKFYYANFKNIPELTTLETKTGGHKHLNEKASNINNVLYYFKKEKPLEYKSLQTRLQKNLKNGDRINFENIKNLQNDGHLKLMICYLILSDPKPLIALDQPDIGLHYDMVDTLLLELRDYVLRNPNTQIFLATHNVNMLDSFSPEEVWLFSRELDKEKIYQIATNRIDANPLVKAMYKEGIGLGSLWYSGYLET